MKMKKYYYSFDVMQIVMMFLIIFANYGAAVPYVASFTPFLGFANGTLFAMYGFLVLRKKNDLTKNLLHTLKVFLIFLVIDVLLTGLYLAFFFENPLELITKRLIFNFLVLNYWEFGFGTHIWYIQATLYALFVFWILKKINLLDKLAIPLCIIGFALSFITGDGSALVHFHVFDYTLFPGNFITRVMPYMLLGKIYRDNQKKFKDITIVGNAMIFAAGVVLAVAEWVILNKLDMLVYYSHMLGFILCTLAILIWCVKCFDVGEEARNPKRLFKIMFYSYNPIAEIIVIMCALYAKDMQTYITILMCVPFVVILFNFLNPVGFGAAMKKLRNMREYYEREKIAGTGFDYDDDDFEE